MVGFVKEDERFLVGDRVTVGFVSNLKNLSPKKKNIYIYIYIYIHTPKLVSNKTLVQNLRRENEYRKMKMNTNPLDPNMPKMSSLMSLGLT